MIDMSSETEITGTLMERATRSAVRWRVPVSEVGTLGLGTRCTLARAMRLASGARTMAPSIFASSDSRWGLKAASSRKPPEQMLSTSGPSPTTMRAPMPGLQDAVEALTQGLAGRDDGQGVEHGLTAPAGHRASVDDDLTGTAGPKVPASFR